MKKHILFISIIWMFITVLLSACWDQRLLRDHGLILAIGYDREYPDKILKTVSFPAPESQVNAEQGSASATSEVISTIGNTVKDAEKKLDKTIPEEFDRSKTRLIIFGEELAKEGIFSTLDSIYRDLRGPINADTAIFTGTAQDALSIQSGEALLISDVYAELIDSAEQSGIIKNYSVSKARPLMLAQGMDLVLPILSLDENDKPQVEGTALFQGDKMTGTLDIKESIVYLMLTNQVNKNLTINLQVSEKHEEPDKNFVNIAIRSNKQKINVETKGGQIKASVEIDLNVEVDEYAEDHLGQKKRIDSLEKKVEQKLKEIADQTIQKMQEAQNDSLGIGEKVRAYHHSTWQNINWKEAYQDIEIDSSFKVEITHHGIIN